METIEHALLDLAKKYIDDNKTLKESMDILTELSPGFKTDKIFTQIYPILYNYVAGN